MRVWGLIVLCAGCSQLLGISGDFAVVDAGPDAPDAHQFSLASYLKASNTGMGDQLGSAIAASRDGSTIAVGAPFEDSLAMGIDGAMAEGAVDAGAVYIYVRSGATWVQQAYVKASNTDAGDHFGQSVALSDDGNTLVVGASFEDSGAVTINGLQTNTAGGMDSGAAYVFVRSGATWAQTTYLKAQNAGAADGYGSAVAISGDGATVAVGAPNEDAPGTGIDNVLADTALGMNSGAAYVYHFDGAAWARQAYVKASNTGANDLFGSTLSLSTDGSTLAVGAPLEDSAARTINGVESDGSANAGAAYVFARSGAIWAQQAYIKPTNADAGDRFGGSVSLAGDGNTLLVGAPLEASGAKGVGPSGDDDNTITDAGAAYLFTRAGTTWSQDRYIKASNTEGGDHFGTFVAMSGDGSTFVVGAPDEDSAATAVGGDQTDNAAPDSGAVYMFVRTPTSWTQTAYVKPASTDAGDQFGVPALLGNTLVVGALGEDGSAMGVGGNPTDNAATNSGAAYVYE